MTAPEATAGPRDGTRAAGPDATGRDRWRHALPWLAVGAAAVALRAWMLAFDLGTTLDSDEAVIGLMGRHILAHGEHPVFFYGQEYMGAVEAYLAAAAFALAGASTLVLKSTMVFLDLVLVASFGWLGCELWNRRVGLLCAWFAAIPPAFLAIYGLKARGGYVETIIVGNVLLAGAARLGRTTGRSAWRLAFVLGAVAGLGFWTHTLVAVYFLPSGLAALGAVRPGDRTGAVGLAALGALAGAMPFWWRNVHDGFLSFGNLSWVGAGLALAHGLGLVSSALPILLGARGPWAASDLVPGASLLLLPIHVLLTAVYFRAVEASGSGRARRWIVTAPWIVATLTVVAYAWSTYGAEDREPRYLVPLYSALALGFGVAADRAASRWGPRALVAAVLLLGFHVLGIARQDPTLMLGISAGERVARSNVRLAGFLEKAGVRSVYTDYWVAYRLVFETGERIRACPFGHVVVERIPAMSDEVARDPNPAFVLLGDAASGFRRALESRGLAFRERELPPYHVFLHVQDAGEVRTWRYPFR